MATSVLRRQINLHRSRRGSSVGLAMGQTEICKPSASGSSEISSRVVIFQGEPLWELGIVLIVRCSKMLSRAIRRNILD